MVFSSPLFLALFLPTLLAAYAAAGNRFRNAVLLAASLLFYAWGEPKAVFLMLALVLADWLSGLAIGRAMAAGRGRAADAALAAGVAASLGALALFKYGSFASQNLRLLGIPAPDPGLALPIGISFYVFQCVSYLVDVRRGAVPAERSLPAFALYVSLFPQLVAGPIVRYETVRGALDDRPFRADDAAFGLARFGRGLAKKVLLADTLGSVADAAFAPDLSTVPQAMAWAGLVCYALQIFLDFSGYSDMAIGLGRVFGFRFPENFDHPYCSTSVREFWRRWHMTLSSWFRDYLYIPLGGSRRGAWRTARNLWIVFALCGLWHGASWCFVAWGLWHGLGLVAGRFLSRGGKAAPARLSAPAALAGNLGTWLFVLVGWIPFKAGTDGRSLAYAARYLRLLVAGNPAVSLSSSRLWADSATAGAAVAFAFALLVSYPGPAARLLPREGSRAFWAVSFVLFAVAYLFAMTSSYSPFLYFRF